MKFYYFTSILYKHVGHWLIIITACTKGEGQKKRICLSIPFLYIFVRVISTYITIFKSCNFYNKSKRNPNLEILLTMIRNTPKGMMENRNHGNTVLTTPRQKRTNVRFWSSISDCIARRTSTVAWERKVGMRVKDMKRPGHRAAERICELRYRGKLLTLVHVSGESVENTSQGCCLEKAHGALKYSLK